MIRNRVVKAQVSVATSDGRKRVLIYDESREWQYETDDPSTVEAVHDHLETWACVHAPESEGNKGYFHATLDESSRVVLGELAPPQEW
jgi:hypothetical protein